MEELIISLFKSGKKKNEIEKEVGCSHKLLNKILRKNGLMSEIVKRGSRTKTEATDEEIAEYLKTHKNKETQEYFKIGPRRIRKVIDSFGIERKRNTWGDLSPEVRAEAHKKAVETMKKRYGVGSITNPSKISQTKSQPGWSEKYREIYSQSSKLAFEKGTRVNPMDNPESRRKISESWADKQQEELDKISSKRKQTMLSKYGVTHSYLVGADQRQPKFISKGEEEVAEFIKSLGLSVIQRDHSLLGNNEIDIYIPEKNFAIEYNGLYWHCSLRKNEYYHYNKLQSCKDLGIRLFHIYEWEWLDSVKREIIKSTLKIALGKVDEKIYARNCEIRNVSTKDYREFCDKNHLQGYRYAEIVYGLYYKDRLVQLMSFAKPQKRNSKKEYQWEIVRGCPGSNNTVIGGVSKLWNHFLRENDPTSAMSYCDANKFDGKSYLTIGMSLVKVDKSNTWYIDKKTYKVGQWLFRNRERRNYQLENSYVVYGAGNLLFEWVK